MREARLQYFKILDELKNGQRKTNGELFYFLDDLYLRLLAGEECLIKHFFTLGSRASGKTHAILIFLLRCFVSLSGNNIIYIVRNRAEGASNTFKELCDKLEDERFFENYDIKSYKGTALFNAHEFSIRFINRQSNNYIRIFYLNEEKSKNKNVKGLATVSCDRMF